MNYIDMLLFIYIIVVFIAAAYVGVFGEFNVKNLSRIAFWPIVVFIVGIKECIKLCRNKEEIQ